MCCKVEAVPRWSADGEKIAIATDFLEKDKTPGELYEIDRDGTTKRLTNFSEKYPGFYIRDLSWSPDGSKIAFWLQTGENPMDVGDEHLAIYDATNEKVTEYCIYGDSVSFHSQSRVPAPIWSPDGTQVLVQNLYSENLSKVFLLDIDQNRVVEIAKNKKPIGWLAEK
jgi:Tol biopolymer transport system component